MYLSLLKTRNVNMIFWYLFTNAGSFIVENFNTDCVQSQVFFHPEEKHLENLTKIGDTAVNQHVLFFKQCFLHFHKQLCYVTFAFDKGFQS